METKATPEHDWLKQLVGEWEYESVCDPGEGQEQFRARGVESVRMLGDLWTLGEGKGAVPGAGEMTAMLMIGFDPARGKFVGSWACSVMATMFVYEGELDADRRVLTLDTTGPDMADPTKQAEYQDVIEMRSPDERMFYSQVKNADGTFTRFMEAVYRRVK